MKRSLVLVIVVALSICEAPWSVEAEQDVVHCQDINPGAHRPHSVTITEFGAVGDGVTLNTKAFSNAIFYLQSFADKGGAKLFVPKGRWLTGSFELISHLTLLLDTEAVILGSQDSGDWPLEDPLPSYGRGRELPGKRHKSLIHGANLTDVIITGDNGTIDGQGDVWWKWFANKTLNYTRPHLIELKNSTQVIISNLTFLNPPFWTIHPVYCSQVVIQNITILAPQDSPNTDGIDPDSSDNVCIEDCYISTGDDMVSIKSGWDEYGISYSRPSVNITIRRLTGETGSSSGLAIGSEMSGGIQGIHAEDLEFFNSANGIRIKTAVGRGGYVRNVYISNVTMTNVTTAFRFTGNYGEHPDESYDPKALPAIYKITIREVVGINISHAGILDGIEDDTFRDICLSKIALSVTKSPPWNCSNVRGYSDDVFPEVCEPLDDRIYPEHTDECYLLPIILKSRVRRNRFVFAQE